MARPRNESPEEEEEEEEEVDELEAAEKNIKDKRKSKGKRKSSTGGSKGKKEKSRENDGDEDEDDVMEEDDDDEEGAGKGKGKKKQAKPQLTEEEISEKAKELVRYAICNEGSRKLLKKDDINKKVLAGANPRSFPQVFTKANKLLKRTFGMELVPLFPREPDETEEAPSSSKKKKRKGKNGEEEDEEEPESSEDDANPNKAKKKKKAAAAKKDTPAAKTAAKSYSLRSLLPPQIISKAILPSPFSPEDEERHSSDLRGSIGEAAMGREELKEYKLGRDEVLDWRRGTEQRTLMGVLNVVLALIMVNERVLTDEQLVNHLKRLDLHLSSPLPLDPSAVRGDKTTLNTFLSLLIKQGYLEKTKLANPIAAAGKGKASSSTQGGTQATQRVRATQGGRGGTQGREEETPASGGGGGGGGGGNADEEWRWGPRSFAEFGEQGIAEFMKAFYSDLANNAAANGAGGGRGRGNAVANGGKDRRTLDKEILKGTTGGKEGGVLQNARQVTEEEEEED